jgi:chromosomal replication initiator protein
MATATESLRADDAVVQDILAELQDRIGAQRFNTWFRHGVCVRLEDGHVSVAVPNTFVGHWIEGHYQRTIAEVAEALTRQARPVVVTIDPTLSGAVRRRQLDQQAEIVAKDTAGRGRRRRRIEQVPLRYRLEDFVVGASNKLAYSASLAVAGSSPAPFNPLFVHGPCGVGKTHLLQGVCNASAKRTVGDRPLAWRYVTAEQFTNDFITSLRGKRLPDFRRRYRALDLLAIDDVHFLAAKKATQDEFLHTYNAIESGGRQVIMASDSPPQLVGDLAEALVSRFVSGMVVKIDAPDRATRLEILRRRAAKMKLRISDDVLEYVAMHIRGSVRELEGSLIKLAALAALEDGRMTVSLAAEALAEHLARTDSAITLGDIEAVVAAYFGITPADIHSSRRTRTVSTARMVAMFLARRHTRMSYPEIGQFMGKNHSSVVLAVQRMERLLRTEDCLRWLTPLGPKEMPAGTLLEMLAEQISRPQ